MGQFIEAEIGQWLSPVTVTLGIGEWELGVAAKGHGVSLGDNKSVLELTVVMAAYTQGHWIVYFKWVNLMAHGLYQ